MVIKTQTTIELPTIDISQPLELSSLSFLAKACKDWGFFLITNHGISDDLYKKIRYLSEQIFCLPTEKKNKLGPLSSEKTYTPHYIASSFYESLRVSGPDFHHSAQSSTRVLFDHHDSEFSELLQEYGTKTTELSKKIVNLVLKSLGGNIEKKYFDCDFKDCHGYFRIINYSPPNALGYEAEGLGVHTDMSVITILHQDDIGGLQVKSTDGNWVDISPCEGTLVVNIGDMLQAWSNDNLRSSQHRVILNKPVSRFSTAFFWRFEDEKVIFAPDEVVREGTRFYKPFICLDYLKFRGRESNEKGKFDKISFTVKDFASIESHAKSPNIIVNHSNCN